MTRSAGAMLAVGLGLGVLLGGWRMERDRATQLALRSRLSTCKVERARARSAAVVELLGDLAECRRANRQCAAAVEAVAKDACGWNLGTTDRVPSLRRAMKR